MRQTKTPKQRAQEVLEVAQRRVERLCAERDRLKDALSLVQDDCEAAGKRLAYVAANPDLDDAEREAT